MKFIKLYESFEDIHSICEKYNIENYTINSDGTIDVDGDVNFYNQRLTKLPLRFGNVSGYFECTHNFLTTLEGCPKSVGSSFACNRNNLISLEGCPQSVGGYFACHNNLLTTLEFSPKSVDGYFDCRNNKLTSLEGCSQSVGGSYFNFSNNLLKDLYGFPEFFDSTIFYSGNPVSDILNLFNRKHKFNRIAKVIDLLNEYGVIQQEGKEVILDRLEEIFYMLNMEIPEIRLKNYEVD